MVINFVLMHNQQYDKNYPLTREMMDKKIQPIPAILWEYGANKIEPSRIPDKDQYLYTLMTPVNAKLSRRNYHIIQLPGTFQKMTNNFRKKCSVQEQRKCLLKYAWISVLLELFIIYVMENS